MDRLKRIASILATAPQWRFHHLQDWRRSVGAARDPLAEAMPWLSWPCIDWLETAVRPGMRVFEYGSGGSTLFFLARGCEVTTVEGNAARAAELRARTVKSAGRLDLRFVDSQTSDPAQRAVYASEAKRGAPWDLILVDGAFRSECLAVAKQCIVPGGTIIVDNTDLAEYADVRAHAVLHDFERRVLRGLGYASVNPTTTEVFTRRGTRLSA